MIVDCEPTAVGGAVAWGVAGRPLPGETESGDLHLVVQFDGGALVAVADGLGHGAEAATAARIAMTVLRECPRLPAIDLVQRCHRALHMTRGVVLGLAAIDAESNELHWIGVGNIEAILLRANAVGRPRRETLSNRGGVVGHQMPPLRVVTHAIAPGDVLVLVTDGVDLTVDFGTAAEWPPQELAEYIVKRHGKTTDDALALVVRYVGCSLR